MKRLYSARGWKGSKYSVVVEQGRAAGFGMKSKYLVMKLTAQQIHAISQDLMCGMVCYIHKDTGVLTSVPDLDPEELFAMTGIREEIYEEVERNPERYIQIEQMPSFEGYRLMEDFTETITNLRIKSRLSDALSRNRPFRRFKDIVENSVDLRQPWFDFKNARYEKWVAQQIALLTEEEE